MGIAAAPAFKWADDKRDRLTKDLVGLRYHFMTNRDPDADSQVQDTHPTHQQRFDAARGQGFDLSKAPTDQIDTLLSHMSRTA